MNGEFLAGDRETTNGTRIHQVMLDGTWEQAGRNPAVAAVIVLLVIGTIYFNGQSILLVISMVLGGGFGKVIAHSGNYIDRLTTSAELQKNPIRVCLVITQYSLLLLPALWIVRKWHSSDIRGYIRLVPCSFPEVLLAVGATAALFPLNIVVSNFFTRSLHVPDFLISINEILMTAHSGKEFLGLVFVVAITPAICEEILFRGYVQRTFERTMGWKSILLAGFIFGLYHMQPLGLITLSSLGFVFGYFYYRSRSLFPPMAAHFTNNFLVLLMLYLKPSLWSNHLFTEKSILLLVIAGTATVEVFIFVIYRRLTAGRKNNHELVYPYSLLPMSNAPPDAY